MYTRNRRGLGELVTLLDGSIVDDAQRGYVPFMDQRLTSIPLSDAYRLLELARRFAGAIPRPALIDPQIFGQIMQGTWAGRNVWQAWLGDVNAYYLSQLWEAARAAGATPQDVHDEAFRSYEEFRRIYLEPLAQVQQDVNGGGYATVIDTPLLTMSAELVRKIVDDSFGQGAEDRRNAQVVAYAKELERTGEPIYTPGGGSAPAPAVPVDRVRAAAREAAQAAQDALEAAGVDTTVSSSIGAPAQRSGLGMAVLMGAGVLGAVKLFGRRRRR